MKSKTLIIPCSGIGKTYGSVAREGAFMVTEDLRPEVSQILPLSLLVLGEEETQEILAGTPVIALDGCKLSCAAKVAAEKGGHVEHALQVLDTFRRCHDLKPEGIAELNEAGYQLAQVLAEDVALLVDQISGEVENG